ncbi:MAG TPA: hypothetical protein VI461_01405, partial [Chitinophagaceae bacterium]|nr:hypothetical protein [Chitinophagaceae bacterium]
NGARFYFQERGWTSVKVCFCDYYTNEPLNGVRFTASMGPSHDIIIDTLTNKHGECQIDLFIPDSLATTMYQVDSWHKQDYMRTAYDRNNFKDRMLEIIPGQKNSFEMWLKPASTIKVQISKQNSLNDTIELVFYNDSGFTDGTLVCSRENLLRENPMIYYWKYDGNSKLIGQWIIKSGLDRDTFRRQVYAPSFDTIDFKISY